jgi:MFS family permease
MTATEPRANSYPVISLRSGRFGAIIAMALLIMIGFGLIIPALPQFVKGFGHREAGIATVVFAFALTRLFGDFFTGPLLDRLGERSVTAIGAAIVGLSSIAAGLSRSFMQLVILRGLGGFGSSFFLGGLMAYIISTTPVEQRGRAMSIFQASFGIGFLIGPALGGAMLAFTSPRTPFYAYGAVCIATVPLILRALTGSPRGAAARGSDSLAEAETPASAEHAPPAPRGPAWRQLRPLLADSAYRAAITASALQFVLSSVELTLIPKFWTDVLHEPRSTSGLPFVVSSLAGLVVIWHAGSLSDRRGRKFTMIPALAVAGAAVTAVGFTHNVIVVLALWGVFGGALGYLRPGPSAMVGDISTPESRGVAVAGYRFAADVGALIGPVMAGVLAQYVSYRAAFLGGGVCALLTLSVAMAARETAPARTAAAAP